MFLFLWIYLIIGVLIAMPATAAFKTDNEKTMPHELVTACLPLVFLLMVVVWFPTLLYVFTNQIANRIRKEQIEDKANE